MPIEKFTIIDDEFVNEDRGDVLIILSDDKVYDQTTKHLTNIDAEWLRKAPDLFSPFGPEEGNPPDIDDVKIIEEAVELPQISGKPPLTGLEDLLSDEPEPPDGLVQINLAPDGLQPEVEVEAEVDVPGLMPFIVVHDGSIIMTGDDLESIKEEMLLEKSLAGELILFKRIISLKTIINQEWEN